MSEGPKMMQAVPVEELAALRAERDALREELERAVVCCGCDLVSHNGVHVGAAGLLREENERLRGALERIATSTRRGAQSIARQALSTPDETPLPERNE